MKKDAQLVHQCLDSCRIRCLSHTIVDLFAHLAHEERHLIASNAARTFVANPLDCVAELIRWHLYATVAGELIRADTFQR